MTIKSIIIPFLFITLGASIATAQSVRLVNSTQQQWSGGIAGRHGSNYTFTIAFTKFKSEPVPDTLWIGNEPIRMEMSASGTNQVNTRVKRTGTAIVFDINASTSSDQNPNHQPYQGELKRPAAHMPIPYKGVAMLCYTYQGARKYFVIKKIVKTYKPVSYP